MFFTYYSELNNVPLVVSYNYLLIILSVLVAIISSFTAFSSAERITSSDKRHKKIMWHMLGAFSMGVGIWVMHFIGMMAMTLPINIFYSPIRTTVSIIPAILASAIVLKHIIKPQSSTELIFNGVLLGAGVGAMHYIGMSAIEVNAVMSYNISVFILSIVVAITLSILSLKVLQKNIEIEAQDYILLNKHSVLASITMGLAISAMHYTAMAAVSFYPTSVQNNPTGISRDLLLLFVITAVILLLVAAIVAPTISRMSQLQQTLKQQREYFELIFEKSGDGILLIQHGQIVDCNEHLVNMLEYDSKKEIMLNPGNISPEYQMDGELSTDKANKMLEICLATGSHYFEWQNKKKGGYIFWCSVLLTRLDHENVPLIHAVLRDISLNKELEESIVKARDAAILANKSKSEFLANMSHELRTPMHGILSFSNFGIKKTKDSNDEQIHRYFNNIKVSGERLLGLLNDLLDLSKLDVNKMIFKKELSSIIDVFEHCRLEQEQRMNDLSLTVQIQQSNPPVMAEFDKVRIAQVITNILSNAIKFSPKRSVITVSVSKTKNNELYFSMHNCGSNIPVKELESIFDAFIQSSETDSGAGGTGLGLSISNKIIKGHGGKIWAENSIDGGVLFSFILPIKEGE